MSDPDLLRTMVVAYADVLDGELEDSGATVQMMHYPHELLKLLGDTSSMDKSLRKSEGTLKSFGRGVARWGTAQGARALALAFSLAAPFVIVSR